MKKIMFLIALGVFLVYSQADAASVGGYLRRDGTYVAPHQRTSPDHNPYNNYNFPGNYNPNSGRTTPGNPDTYLDRYNNGDRSRGITPGGSDTGYRDYNKGRSSGGLGNYDPFKPYGAR